MAAVDRILSGCIPCYGMMKKAMPGPEKKSRKKYENRRLTEVDPKTKKPRLKKSSICLRIRTYCPIRLRK